MPLCHPIYSTEYMMCVHTNIMPRMFKIKIRTWDFYVLELYSITSVLRAILLHTIRNLQIDGMYVLPFTSLISLVTISLAAGNKKLNYYVILAGNFLNFPKLFILLCCLDVFFFYLFFVVVNASLNVMHAVSKSSRANCVFFFRQLDEITANIMLS